VTEPFGLHIDKSAEGLKRPRNESAIRMYIVMVVFLAGFIVVAMRLFHIQILQSREYKELAQLQYQSREILKPARGLILDRKLSILASNITEYAISIDPTVMERPDTAIRALARYLPRSYAFYMQKITKTKSKYIVLEKAVNEETIEPLKKWRCYGVRFESKPKRKYNFNSLAGPVIGYTNVANKGQSGIELAMDDELVGKEGFIVYQLNAKRVKRPEVEYPHLEPVKGRSVVLTIDQSYQAIAEEELVKGVQQFAAESGRCIIMQPKTGEILAMANYPSMNPNDRRNYSPEKARNRVITDLYEPGSTFKIVAMSAALNEGMYEPEDKIWAENGKYYHTPNEKPIEDDHKYGWLTLRGAFEHSSNIVSAKIAEQLGKELFYKYARNFGFGIKTGIELPGELRGDLRNPINWDRSTHRYMAFGYGLAATSLQIACAYSAIANDGVLMRPYIRKWLLDENRNIIDETVPQTVRRVVSSETAATMREFMRGVVDSGTASRAKIAGIAIGGKTGTSQRLVKGNYSDKSHVASFVGFFPADDPKVLILVILDAPTNGYYGGMVAAPIFREIALRIINSSSEFAKQPESVARTAIVQNTGSVPDLRGMPVRAAKKIAELQGFEVSAKSGSGIILAQDPEAGGVERRNTVIRVMTRKEYKYKNGRGIVVPDMHGLGLRQAMCMAGEIGLDIRVEGSGKVVSQIPAPGTVVHPNAVFSVSCKSRDIGQVNIY